MKFPLILINFKAYEASTLSQAALLVKLVSEVASDSGASLAVAVSATDLHTISSNVSLPVFAQHTDPCDFGAHTGHLPATLAVRAGAQGTLLNHAERKLESSVLALSVEFAKKAGLFVVVCAESLQRVTDVVPLAPDAIAYEPPELIGGNVSVSTAQPDVIRQAVSLAGSVPLLVGAGVKTEEDVRLSIQLGAKGVLLASGVVLAPDPQTVLRSLIKGLS